MSFWKTLILDIAHFPDFKFYYKVILTKQYGTGIKIAKSLDKNWGPKTNP